MSSACSTASITALRGLVRAWLSKEEELVTYAPARESARDVVMIGCSGSCTCVAVIGTGDMLVSVWVWC